MKLANGTTLGPYEIRERIGAGGMGEVYRARDSRLGRDVAVKVSEERFSERFEREARAVAALNHRNICTLHDVGPNYLVMELVEGETLAQLAGSPLPLETALNYARQIGDALEAAHEKGIIHRDLKLGNIMIKPDGTVKVLDFGLAKIGGIPSGNAEDSPTIDNAATQAGVILGTAAYMSPEQARGKTVDKRADVWAFGVVLYEMLTGKRLFEGETISDTLAAVLKTEPDWNEIPLKARRLLQSCLEKDPRHRLRDIGDAKFLLEDTPKTLARPKSAAPWAIAGALFIVAVAGLWAPWREPLQTEQPAMNLDVDLGPDAVLLDASGPPMILSPDGTRLVFVAQQTGGESSLFTRRLDQPKPTPIAGTAGARGPFFSPDGQWVGFFADGKMKKIRLEGGEATTLCDAPAGRGASWGDNDRIIASLNTTNGLTSIPAAGGAAVPVTKLEGGQSGGHRWPQVLPGSKAVLFTTSSNAADWREASIAVASLQDGQTKILLDHVGMYGRFVAGGYLVYISNGALFGVRFDPDRLEVRGSPVALLEHVSYRPTGGSANLDFSQNGAAVYRSGAESGLLIVQWLDAAGRTVPLLAKPLIYLFPHLSPDGGRLAVTQTAGSGSDVWVYDLQRDIPTRLTTGLGVNRALTWSPDGHYMVFGSQGGMSWTRADGAGTPQSLTESNVEQMPVSFTPDGKRLAFFEQNSVTGTEIRTVPVTNESGQLRAGKPELYLKLPSGYPSPSFSPDGRWLAYASTESGGYEVYVRAFPDNGARWRVSNNGGMHPVWSRNGRELFYRTDDQRIMVATYTAKGDSFMSDKPRLWSEKQLANTGLNPTFDLAPDGKRVATMMPVESPEAPETRGHVTLVLNFFDELRRRMLASGN